MLALRFVVLVAALMGFAVNSANADNVLAIDQANNTAGSTGLNLTAIQIGTDNKIVGSKENAFSVASDRTATVSGDSQTIELLQSGNNNIIRMDMLGTGLSLAANIEGSSNLFRLECGDSGSCDDLTLAVRAVGDTNSVDLALGTTTAITGATIVANIEGSSNIWGFTATTRTNSLATASLANEALIATGTAASLTNVNPQIVDFSGDTPFTFTGNAVNFDLVNATAGPFSAADFAAVNEIDGANHNVEVAILGSSNNLVTQISGDGHLVDIYIDADDTNSSLKLDGSDSTIRLDLQGEDSQVGVISCEASC